MKSYLPTASVLPIKFYLPNASDFYSAGNQGHKVHDDTLIHQDLFIPISLHEQMLAIQIFSMGSIDVLGLPILFHLSHATSRTLLRNLDVCVKPLAHSTTCFSQLQDIKHKW
jgi:hypothetical protein